MPAPVTERRPSTLVLSVRVRAFGPWLVLRSLTLGLAGLHPATWSLIVSLCSSPFWAVILTGASRFSPHWLADARLVLFLLVNCEYAPAGRSASKEENGASGIDGNVALRTPAVETKDSPVTSSVMPSP